MKLNRGRIRTKHILAGIMAGLLAITVGISVLTARASRLSKVAAETILFKKGHSDKIKGTVATARSIVWPSTSTVCM